MSDSYDPSEHTVDEVKEYVTDNPGQAGEVLAAEQAGKNRTTLTDWLDEQANAPAPTVVNDDPSAVEPEPEPESEEPQYKLPPTLAEAGGVGIVGTVSGMFTVSNGSYMLSPGQPLVMSAEDAQTLVDQGVAVMLDQYKTT